MKKVLTVLAIMAIAMGMVFATSNLTDSASTGNSLSFDGSADLTVKFTPDTDMTQFFDIGFSSNAINGLTEDNSIPDVTAKNDITLTKEVSGGTGDYQNAESVYLYYIVKGANVRISMQAGDNLSYDSNDGDTISWKAVANDVEVSSSADAASEVVTVEATSEIKAYSYPITISTVNLASTTLKADQEYSSTLKLTIAAAI